MDSLHAMSQNVSTTAMAAAIRTRLTISVWTRGPVGLVRLVRLLTLERKMIVNPTVTIGLPVRALAPTARRQPRATVGGWVILSTAVLVTRMVVRQRPDRLLIVSKLRKSGARASVGASPAKVHAI